MQQIFYTQEGSKYIIKTANKFTNPVNLGSPETVQLYAMIKPDGSLTPAYHNIVINTSKKIIPIGFTFSVIESGTTSIADISSVFTYIQNSSGSTPRPASNSTYLAKMIPFVYTDYYTSNMFYAQRYKYKDVIFSDSDFNDTSSSITIFSSLTQSGALTGLGTSDDQFTMPAGFFTTIITFTYFELIN